MDVFSTAESRLLEVLRLRGRFLQAHAGRSRPDEPIKVIRAPTIRARSFVHCRALNSGRLLTNEPNHWQPICTSSTSTFKLFTHLQTHSGHLSTDELVKTVCVPMSPCRLQIMDFVHWRAHESSPLGA
ncbi:hypothetical protein BDY19DRAFT_943855 [Irpex rosettiformis]|uniref:Uncharacterized protein n=1 Tax=Irpex rosettiformis TaxID=378272 RepID=A0ACB8U5M7_9APHY|nr:hypothetical protein BDY19DRAFT_943855 [Irpex rosettiformis]